MAQTATQSPSQAAISPQLEPAPDIFQATGRAIWDGKRTLQGVWVAHPLAASARRVRIFNVETGAAADGALFKRDAALEGAPVLISSEAAQLLGMTAGVEAQLRIVAVSPIKSRAAEAKPSAETADAEQPEAEQPAASPAPEAAAAQPTVPEQQGPETAEAPAPEVAEVAPAPTVQEEAPAKPDPEPEPEAAQSTALAAADPNPQPAPKPKAPAPAPSADDTDDEPERPEHKDRVFKFEQPPQSGPEAERKPDVKTAAKSDAQPSRLRQPFVQAGVFGVPENARRLVRRLKSKGIPALRKTFKSGEKTMNRVLAGPFNSTRARNQAQATIRAMGLTDAVPVRR